MKQVREPLRWCLQLGQRTHAKDVEPVLRRALLGPAQEAWLPPDWLLPHQIIAAQRTSGSLRAFGGALLCDAVGLGKTYVACAIATLYDSALVVSPAVLVPQWLAVSRGLNVPIITVSHEALSRRATLPPTDIIVVDEAHRFRNTSTVRYDYLARAARRADLFMLTATPVVNDPKDIAGLLRLFARDHAFALFGIPSIEEAAHRRNGTALAGGIAPAIVARSPETAGSISTQMPIANDQPILTPPPLERGLLDRVVTKLDRLEFPTFGDRTTAALLRLHIQHRLSSSVSACVDCLNRHRAYLERAITAAQQGTTLSRRESRNLFGPDDGPQLELKLLAATHSLPSLDASSLKREHIRISQILMLLERTRSNPKGERLRRLVAARRRAAPRQKTIVFTAAIATAHEIAASLDWHRTAVVTGRGARIASGPLPMEAALAMFAPHARGAAAPKRRAELDVLIATDLVSEGLNLQDADAVVHFDLPWNPLRLQQRIGRIARLGSAHRHVFVWWFVPTPILERRLKLRQRIDAKVNHQRNLGVAVTSTVGKAKVLGRSLEIRERNAATLTRGRAPPQFAVVRGPAAAVFAVRWWFDGSDVPDLLAFQGSPPRLVSDIAEACGLLNGLLGATRSLATANPALQHALATELRSRMSHAINGPVDSPTQRLVRTVLAMAAKAGAARRVAELNVLDAVLDEIGRGMRLGAARELDSALRDPAATASLRKWLGRWRVQAGGTPVVSLEAALFGDGTVD